MSSIAVNAITDANAGNTATINSVTPNVNNVVGKNRIINGNMGIWQRGTSFSNVSTTNNYYTADRWGANRSSNASGLTVSQSTDVPAGFKYSAKFQREASNTATNTLSIFNSNESINTLDFANQSVTFSFYAKVGANWSASNDINVVIRSGTGTDQRAYQFTGLVSQSSTVTITNSWAKYSITKTVPASATEVGVMIQSGAYSGTAGADDSLYITGVQLEAGSSATEFEHRQYGTELSLCQRYARKITVAPGTWSSTIRCDVMISHIGMRASPSVVSGTALVCTDFAYANFTQSSFSVTPAFTNADGGSYWIGNFTGATTGRSGGLANSASNLILLTAEL